MVDGDLLDLLVRVERLEGELDCVRVCLDDLEGDLGVVRGRLDGWLRGVVLLVVGGLLGLFFELL